MTETTGKNSTKTFNILELYSGIGGFHFAIKKLFTELGIDNYHIREKLFTELGIDDYKITAIDINTSANEVYRWNHLRDSTTKQKHILLERNIQSFSCDDFDRMELDLLTMSPPCQPFSRLGLKRDLNDNRCCSFQHLMVNIIPNLRNKPRFIMLENVKGFETSEAHHLLLDTLSRTGYQFEQFLISPQQFSIPNSRLRYYLIGSLSANIDPSSVIKNSRLIKTKIPIINGYSNCSIFCSKCNKNEQSSNEQLSNEQLSNEQLSNEQLSNEQLSNEQLSNEQLSNEQLCNEQLNNEQSSNEQLSNEQLNNEQSSNEQLNNEQLNNEQLSNEQLSNEQLNNEQLNNEQLNNEQLNNEQLNNEQLNNEQLNNEELSNEQLNNEQLNNEQLSNEQLNNEQLNNEQLNNEQLNNEELSNEQLNNEQLNNEQLSNEQLSNEQLNNEQLNNEQLNNEQLNNEQLNNEQLNNEELNNEQLNNEQLNNEQLNNEQLNNEQLNNEQLNNEELSNEQLNNEQLNNEQLSNEQLNNEQLNNEQLNNEQLNNEELSNEQLNNEQLNNEQLSNEQLSNEQLSNEQLSNEQSFCSYVDQIEILDDFDENEQTKKLSSINHCLINDCLIKTVSEYIEQEEESLINRSNHYQINDDLLLRYHMLFDLVLPDSKSTNCFTKSYGHRLEGSGSILKTSKITDIDTVYGEVVRIKEMKTGNEDDDRKIVELLRSLELRFFTPKEIANLMCFPSTLEFPAKFNTKQQYRLLGNSVNVLVCYYLLRILIGSTNNKHTHNKTGP